MIRMFLSILSISFAVTVASYPASAAVSEKDIDIYIKACTTGISSSKEGRADLDILRRGILGFGASVGFKYSESEIATVIDKVPAGDRRLLLSDISRCIKDYIETYSSESNVHVQRDALLVMISEVNAFKKFAKDVKETVPKRLDIANAESVLANDARLNAATSFDRYVAFLDPAGLQLTATRLSPSTFPLFCSYHQEEVRKYNDFKSSIYYATQNSNKPVALSDYSIPRQFDEYCSKSNLVFKPR